MGFVRIRLFSIFSEAVGASEIVVEKTGRMKISDVVKILENKYPVFHEVRKRVPVIILLNGKPVRDHKRGVEDSSEIAILPPMSGG